MPFKKFASTDVEFALFTPDDKVHTITSSGYQFDRKPGMTYVVTRAISARINRNYDGFPPYELEKAAHTFIGRPVFVNHENQDHRRTRGIILDSKYKESGKDKYIELLIEIDAKKFPKLAKRIADGDVDSVSMGTACEYTKCSACGNIARDWTDFCDHIPMKKGQKVHVEGSPDPITVYESCHGLNFFEISFVFDPADETALLTNVITAVKTAKLAEEKKCKYCHNKATRSMFWGAGIGYVHTCDDHAHMGGDADANEAADGDDGGGAATTAKLIQDSLDKMNKDIKGAVAKLNQTLAYGEPIAPANVDTLRQDTLCPQCNQVIDEGKVCPLCGYELPPEGLGDPDTSIAPQVDLRQDQGDQQVEVNQNGDSIDPQQDTGLPGDPNGGQLKTDPNNPRPSMIPGKDNAAAPGETPSAEDRVLNKSAPENNNPVGDPNDQQNTDLGNRLPTVNENDPKVIDDSDDPKKKNPKLHAALEARKLARDEQESFVSTIEDLVVSIFRVGNVWVGELCDADGIIKTEDFDSLTEAQEFTQNLANEIVDLSNLD